MFDVGWSELVVIGVVALIVIGPKELPAVLRAVGQWTTKIRRMAGEFQSQFQEAMREAEMSDLKKHVAELDAAAKGIATDFDPLDLKEATKWEPKAPSASDAAAESESASLSEFASPAARRYYARACRTGPQLRSAPRPRRSRTPPASRRRSS